MLFKNTVRTSKRTPHFTITKINWLTLFKEIIAVYSEPYETYKRTLVRKMQQYLNVKIQIHKTHFNIIIPQMHVTWSFPFGFSGQNFARNSHIHTRATCPVSHTLLDLIVITTLPRNTNSEAPHYAVFSSLLAQHPCYICVLPTTPFPSTLTSLLSLM
jgi:hypothetical protein